MAKNRLNEIQFEFPTFVDKSSQCGFFKKFDLGKTRQHFTPQPSGFVHESMELDVSLLGISFLNRMEMNREGAQMVLTKRY